MKLKNKIISILLLIATALSLSSCLFYTTVSDMTDTPQTPVGDVTINVDEVKNHDISINTSESDSEVAAAKALMSSVSIQTSAASGSGVIFKLSEDKSEAYILTNYHVVYDSSTRQISRNIKVYLYGMESYLYGTNPDYAMYAAYVGGTVKYDLAVLKVTASEVLLRSNARACEFADSNKVTVLETAIAVGNAAGDGISATMGKVNVESENIALYAADEKTKLTLRVMRTDAAVNSGNSGGGLFNAKGELIGIVNAKSAASSTDNIGYAIPSNVAKYIAENIMYYCDGTKVQFAYKCMLGITVSVKELYTEYDEEKGILYRKERVAVDTIPEKTAAAYGILKAGDVINSITIDGVTYEVSRMFHVVDAMLNARVSSSVVINVTRSGKALDLTVPLANKDIVNADS